MAEVKKYHSIFLAIDYKKRFQKLLEKIDKGPLNTKHGLTQSIIESGSSGVRSLKLDLKNKLKGQLYISLDKITLEIVDESGINIENVNEAVEIIKEGIVLYEENINENPEINFIGVVIKKIIILNDEEKERINSFYFNKNSNRKKIEFKLNIIDENKFNNNIFFNYSLEENELFVTYDINSIHIDDKSAYDLETLLEKAKNTIDDREMLFSFLIHNKE